MLTRMSIRPCSRSTSASTCSNEPTSATSHTMVRLAAERPRSWTSSSRSNGSDYTDHRLTAGCEVERHLPADPAGGPRHDRDLRLKRRSLIAAPATSDTVGRGRTELKALSVGAVLTWTASHRDAVRASQPRSGTRPTQVCCGPAGGRGPLRGRGVEPGCGAGRRRPVRCGDLRPRRCRGRRW